MTQHAHAGHHGHGAGRSVVEVSFKNCSDASEYADLEGNLATVPGVTSVHLDRTRGVAHLGYDPGRVTPEELERRLHAAGYACDCEDEPASAAQPGHPQVGHEHPGMARTSGGHAGHHAHAGRMPEDHAEYGVRADMGPGGHAGHGAETVQGMLRRFVVSLPLTLPIVLFSPIGESPGFHPVGHRPGRLPDLRPATLHGDGGQRPLGEEVFPLTQLPGQPRLGPGPEGVKGLGELRRQLGQAPLPGALWQEIGVEVLVIHTSAARNTSSTHSS